jgi:hypothetical protein
VVRHGFRVSISLNAFVEDWTRSVREDNYHRLVTRAQRLRSTIDSETPLLPTGLQLTGLLGGRARDGTPTRHDELMQWCRRIWQVASTGQVDDALWKRGALAGELTMRDHHSSWKGLRDLTPSMFPELAHMSESRAVSVLAAEFLKIAAREEILRGNVQSRKHAFYTVAALHAVRALKYPGSYSRDPNTAEDIDLLQHLATPAVLLTRDFDLIEDVDYSGTFQRPWVRTLGELLKDGSPPGRPWGRRARRFAQKFRRRTRKELGALESSIAAEIGAASA